MKSTTYIKTLLEKVFTKRKATKYRLILEKYNIFTIEQLFGAINPSLPEFSEKEIKERVLSPKYSSLNKSNHRDKSINRINNVLNSTYTDASKILNSINTVDFPKQSMSVNLSELSLGVIAKQNIKRTTFWNTAIFNTSKSRYVIPNYEDMGPVFDQGERGTCVANAFASVLNYLSKANASRQFLYHQCKVFDGIPNSSGTYMGTAEDVISKSSLVDYGVVAEKEWIYKTNTTNTEAQGPPPEGCFNSKRIIALNPIHARKATFIDDIKKLLNGSNLHKPSPVTIAIDLYESFNNQSSRRTGWINMPLPGESKTGGHAMVIVGYFDDEELFLVRNSWATSWAYENSYGYNGHALIPYDYINQYCRYAASMINYEERRLIVDYEDRLYIKGLSENRYSKKAAHKILSSSSKTLKKVPKRKLKIIPPKKPTMIKKKIKREKKKKYSLLKLYAVILTIIIAIQYGSFINKLFTQLSNEFNIHIAYNDWWFQEIFK